MRRKLYSTSSHPGLNKLNNRVRRSTRWYEILPAAATRAFMHQVKPLDYVENAGFNPVYVDTIP